MKEMYQPYYMFFLGSRKDIDFFAQCFFYMKGIFAVKCMLIVLLSRDAICWL